MTSISKIALRQNGAPSIKVLYEKSEEGFCSGAKAMI
jgi:hypothetical protein